MSTSPTLVLVPGAWHSPDVWGKIITGLETHHKCVPVALPTTCSNPEATFSDDVRAVKNAIIKETTQGRDVVVVVHSYGGAVGSSSIKGLTKSSQETPRAEATSDGHVIGLFMMATGFMVTGTTFLDGFGGNPPPIWDLNQETGFVDIVVDPRELFYHDLPQDEGTHWVERLLKQSIRGLTEGAQDAYAGWKEVPIWYLVTTEDKALPVEAQRIFLQSARDSGADITVREIASSHSPMLSRPSETVGYVLEATSFFAGSGE